MTGRVLVVDDVPANVKLLEIKLASEYYDVVTASNGFEALEKVKTHMPDIILLDIMMPEMDGFEACKRLKADPEVAHIPVVMVTALSDVQDRVQGLQAGADDFLTKPINDLALFARIRSLLRLKFMMDELRLRDQTGEQFGLLGDLHEHINMLAGANVAIVDDDMIQAKQIAQGLGSIGINSFIIPQPDQVLPTIAAHPFDIIIVSTQLLDIDGLRLCSQIRSSEVGRNVPLLILIEEGETNILVKGLDMGVNDYLVTPLDTNELTARVITQIKRKRYQDALRSNYHQSVSMAITDALTGVHNRRYFEVHGQNMLQQSLAKNKPISLAIMDIDFFKKINDGYGHVVGDEILRQVPECIKQSLRPTDLIARFGGEEFIVMLPETGIPPAEDVADRIRSTIENQVFKISGGDGTLRCTVSIGVASGIPGDTLQSLLERADKCLYEAKGAGRNRVMANKDML